MFAAGTGSPPSLAATAGAVNLRKDIEKLTAAELQAYEHAIKILKDRSNVDPNDPTGYAYWAALHDVSDESIHSGCTHFSEKFFPWHRRYLFDFEALLQKTDPPSYGECHDPLLGLDEKAYGRGPISRRPSRRRVRRFSTTGCRSVRRHGIPPTFTT